MISLNLQGLKINIVILHLYLTCEVNFDPVSLFADTTVYDCHVMNGCSYKDEYRILFDAVNSTLRLKEYQTF